MRMQVLVSTMFQDDYSLLEKMNIQTDAVVINQCNKNEVSEFLYNGCSIKWISTTDRGVGRSRNLAIMNSTADILLFADDDVRYCEGVKEKVLEFFQKYAKVSLATFNLNSLNSQRPEAIVRKTHRIHTWNCLKYGAFRIAVRREALLKKNIYFSLLFGGGAIYSAGEDNLFITKCIQHGLVCYACDSMIGTVAQMESTWFVGYDEKYYLDRGALFSAMYGKGAYIMLMIFELRHIDKKMFYRLSKEFAGVKKY